MRGIHLSSNCKINAPYPFKKIYKHLFAYETYDISEANFINQQLKIEIFTEKVVVASKNRTFWRH